jgi:3-hydroxyacyl-CoA dehydrogenase/enoyl-CoA hydratase/3-hydroxybutyryl-CoA epimerase
MIDSVGSAAFVAQCERLAAAHGDRFAPPAQLKAMAAASAAYYTER